jgi:hypothetical protein
VTDGIFQAALSATQQQGADRLGGPRVSQAAVDGFARRSQAAYSAVLDRDGKRLAATKTAPAHLGPATDTARSTGKPRLSDVMKMGSAAVVEWAIPYASASGQRIYVQGIPTSNFTAFLKASLGKVPDFGDAETVMVDGNGVVLGGVKLSARVGGRLPDQDLLDALKDAEHGDYGNDRYFASGPITDSPFRIVLDTSHSRLYDSLGANRTTVPWLIFAAFALAASAGLFFLRRSLTSAAELQRRELNERHAVEINDNIIQGLALAKYQLQAGEGEASAAQVSETLREAQRLVSGLLGDAEVQAGQLRREIAAETSRPEPPPTEPRT